MLYIMFLPPSLKKQTSFAPAKFFSSLPLTKTSISKMKKEKSIQKSGNIILHFEQKISALCFLQYFLCAWQKSCDAVINLPRTNSWGDERF